MSTNHRVPKLQSEIQNTKAQYYMKGTPINILIGQLNELSLRKDNVW